MMPDIVNAVVGGPEGAMIKVKKTSQSDVDKLESAISLEPVEGDERRDAGADGARVSSDKWKMKGRGPGRGKQGDDKAQGDEDEVVEGTESGHEPVMLCFGTWNAHQLKENHGKELLAKI